MLILNRQQVREVDRRAVEHYKMSSLVLMENAGRGLADLVCRLGIDGPVFIACGKGNNAGDGFVLARHLAIRGHEPRVGLFYRREEYEGDGAANLRILERAGAALIDLAQGEAGFKERALSRELEHVTLVVDALLGTGATGDPRPPLDTVIRRLNESAARKLAVDIPSGLDCDTGQTGEPTFVADHTATFVAAKPGLAPPLAPQQVGELHVLDIGAPPSLIDDVAKSAE